MPHRQNEDKNFHYLAYGKSNIGQIRRDDGEGQKEDKEINA